MGRSYRQDSKNDKLRREKQRKNNPNQQWQKPVGDSDNQSNDRYSPFDDPPEHHEQFA
jgi:hypothetical protein